MEGRARRDRGRNFRASGPRLENFPQPISIGRLSNTKDTMDTKVEVNHCLRVLGVLCGVDRYRGRQLIGDDRVRASAISARTPEVRPQRYWAAREQCRFVSMQRPDEFGRRGDHAEEKRPNQHRHDEHETDQLKLASAFDVIEDMRSPMR